MKQMTCLDIRNAKCTLCDLHSAARTVCVMGKGSIPSRLLLLGDSPGEEEDKKGEPFIGKAGKLLDSVLTTLGIDRKEIYLTNTVKCHPLFNHKPSVSKVDICTTAYLRREIQAVQPELIICLGSMAAKTLVQDVNIQVANMRNTLLHTKGPMPQGIPFIITYHPAAALYPAGEHLLQFIVEDFEWALRLLNGELPKPLARRKYKPAQSIWKIPNIRKAKWIDLDLETDGLDAFLPNKDIMSVQLSIKEGEAYYLEWNRKIKRQLTKLLADYPCYINGHNIKFDLRWLRSRAGIIFDKEINDTIQNIHLLDENFPDKSLDALATSFTKLKGHKRDYQNLIRAYIKMHKEKKEPIKQAFARLYKQAFFAVPVNTRIKYGCGDADATGRLRRLFLPKIKKEGLLPLHKMMNNVTKMYVDMEYNGMHVDIMTLDVYKNVYNKRIDKLIAQLDILAGKELNHNAPLQLRQLFYGDWKLPVYEVRQGKRRVRHSTGKDAIALILNDNIDTGHREYLEKLLRFRKITKLNNTYVKGLPRYIREGNLVHAEWRLDGTDTGRTSCTNPPIQQIPRKGDIKRVFNSRFGKDGVLMQLDVSQGELRIAAQVSREKNLTRLFREGIHDIHTMVAASIFHKLPEDVTEDERFIAKTVNFLILYGGGIKTLAQAIKRSDKEAAIILRTWNKQFPGWREYEEEVKRGILDSGYVRNLFGRYRRIHISNPDSPEGAAALRVAVNAPIQGGLSDYTKLCGYNLWNKVKSPEVLVIMEGHDAFVLDMKKQHVNRVAQIAKEEFENVDTSEFGFKFNVPMKIEIKVGPNWKDMEEYEI